MSTDWHDLIQRYMAGQTSEEEAASLQDSLKRDDAVARLYLRYMNLDVALEAHAGSRAAVEEMLGAQPRSISKGPAHWFAWRPLAAAAAVLLLVGATWMSLRPQVVVQANVGAEFVTAFGSRELTGQSAELKSGLIELNFRKADASVVIEAPAKFRIVDAKTLRLVSGRVTAHVRDGKQGLRVITPHTDVLDLGTRFAVDVTDGQRSEVHVFDGQVEAGTGDVAHRDLLTKNQALRFAASAKPESRDVRSGTFVQPEEMKGLAAGVRAGQEQRSRQMEAELWHDPALIGWIGFESVNEGAAVQGARPVQGRFPGQHALEFVDADDHATLNLQAAPRQLTLMTWVRLDRIPTGISSLYHTDGWDTPGQVHWMILNNGQMRFALYGAPVADLEDGRMKFPESHVPVLDQLGRWVHLAAVYDADTQKVSFFSNGQFDSTVEMQTGLPAVLGPAQIGNWNIKNSYGTSHRRLSGRMDELVALSRALSAEEIRRHFEAGNPYR